MFNNTRIPKSRISVPLLSLRLLSLKSNVQASFCRLTFYFRSMVGPLWHYDVAVPKTSPREDHHGGLYRAEDLDEHHALYR